MLKSTMPAVSIAESFLGVNEQTALAPSGYPQIIVKIQPVYISWLLVRRALAPWQGYSANSSHHQAITLLAYLLQDVTVIKTNQAP